MLFRSYELQLTKDGRAVSIGRNNDAHPIDAWAKPYIGTFHSGRQILGRDPDRSVATTAAEREQIEHLATAAPDVQAAEIIATRHGNELKIRFLATHAQPIRPARIG